MFSYFVRPRKAPGANSMGVPGMADADGDGEIYVLELLAELRGEAERLHRDVFETSCRLNRLARTLSNGNLPNVLRD